jgi:hypothetical protein
VLSREIERSTALSVQPGRAGGPHLNRRVSNRCISSAATPTTPRSTPSWSAASTDQLPLLALTRPAAGHSSRPRFSADLRLLADVLLVPVAIVVVTLTVHPPTARLAITRLAPHRLHRARDLHHPGSWLGLM